MYKKTSFLLLFLLLIILKSFAASALRSDTIDIRKTKIDFTITDFTSNIISAKTTLDIQSKLNNVQSLQFDLEGFVVDSIKINGSAWAFNYTSPSLWINLSSSPLNQFDTAIVDVYYHGIPVADATWGGFSFIGNYGFQMGVGFNAQPHSFGRTWHPCFDNFVERSSYEFFITTTSDKLAVCNGLFIDSVLNTSNNTIRWHWKLNEEIPSYLSCVAVCNYTFVKKILTGINGPIDAWIACEPADSNKVNGSFAHLQQAYSMLEAHFGAYSWPRVGYSLVPFNAGAMEHATNISIGKPFVDGTLNYETLIAHELSHHWFGDLVTCSTAGDMWLNEGFASYCEALHLESTYDYASYLDQIRSNHFSALSTAHIKDDGYKSVSNMDSLHTYGTTVYLKGEDALHTLRTYLGDSLFFSGIKSFVNTHKFQAINTNDLKNYLSTYSGINLNNYFLNWIEAPGFTHFSIDSNQVVPNGATYDCKVFLRQRKAHSLDYYTDVPLELAFYDNQMQAHIYNITFTGRCMEFDVNLPFEPSMIVIDPNSKISYAITDNTKIINNTGITTLLQAKCRLHIKQLVNSSDSSLVRIEHNWLAPDRFKNQNSFPGYVLNDAHSWTVHGINLSNTTGLLQFTYDAGINNNYLDSTWLKNAEDSIRLFYRKDATEEWQFANDSLRIGAATDKQGNVYAKEIKAGEYAFGIKRSSFIDPLQTDAPIGSCGIVTLLENPKGNFDNELDLFPNPSSTKVTIRIKNASLTNTHFLELFNQVGQLVYSIPISQTTTSLELNVSSFKRGIYIVKVGTLFKKLSVH